MTIKAVICDRGTEFKKLNHTTDLQGFKKIETHRLSKYKRGKVTNQLVQK